MMDVPAVGPIVESVAAAWKCVSSSAQYGNMPLLLAISKGNADIATALLAAPGIDVNKEDKYGHTPLSYLPQRAKRIGLMTPSVDGQSAQWAVEVVGKDGTVAAGSVAQSAAVRILHA